MDNYDLLKSWQAEERAFAMEGWDFSRIDRRWSVPEPPWDYRHLVNAYLKDSHMLLDMGTGGGEVLLTLVHPYQNTCVTEAYVPNLELCKARLSPLGITVAQTFDDDLLPFEDEIFDVVINRHESFLLPEVNRVLKPGGYFITQQVGGCNGVDLAQRFIPGFYPHNPNHNIGYYTDALKGLGFRIIAADELVYDKYFFDIGAVIFYAKACPWEVPGFSVKGNFEQLLECQREIDESGRLKATGHRFVIIAHKEE